MAALTDHEWAEVRREWETSAHRGLGWLSAKAGGRWDISEEALRRRRAREGWRKRLDMPDVVLRAHAAADRAIEEAERATEAMRGGVVPGVAPPPDAVPGPDETAAPDVRTRLVEMHRAEWRAARRLVWAAMRAAEEARGLDKARFAEMAARTLHTLQDGERKAWGLDIDLIDLDKLSLEQLGRIAAGKPL
jgi:hypothetical protein